MGRADRATRLNPPAPESFRRVFTRPVSRRLAATVTMMKLAQASTAIVSRLRSQFSAPPRQASVSSEGARRARGRGRARKASSRLRMPISSAVPPPKKAAVVENNPNTPEATSSAPASTSAPMPIHLARSATASLAFAASALQPVSRSRAGVFLNMRKAHQIATSATTRPPTAPPITLTAVTWSERGNSPMTPCQRVCRPQMMAFAYPIPSGAPTSAPASETRNASPSRMRDAREESNPTASSIPN